jgi:hypothetical protein
MIDIFLDYEWLINLICMSIFTGGMFLSTKTVLMNGIISTIITMSYLVLLLNVVFNSLVKGF